MARVPWTQTRHVLSHTARGPPGCPHSPLPRNSPPGQLPGGAVPPLPSAEKRFAPSDLRRHCNRGQTHVASVRATRWPPTEGRAFSSVNGGKKGRGSRAGGSAFTHQNPHIVPSGHPSTRFGKTYVSLDILHLKRSWSFPETASRGVIAVLGFTRTPRRWPLLSSPVRGACSASGALTDVAPASLRRRPHVGFDLRTWWDLGSGRGRLRQRWVRANGPLGHTAAPG